MHFKSPEFCRCVCHLRRVAVVCRSFKRSARVFVLAPLRRAIGAGAKAGCATSQEAQETSQERDGCADCKELASKTRGRSVLRNQAGELEETTIFVKLWFPVGAWQVFIRKQDSNTVWCFKEIYSVAIATHLVEYYIRQANRYQDICSPF